MKLIKATPSDMSFVSNFSLRRIDNVWIIYKDNTAIGVLEYKINDFRAHIEYLCFLDEHKGYGYGRGVISMLLESNDVEEIYGDAVPSSVGFWFKCGAEFDEDIDDIESDCCIPFFIIK